MSYGRYGAVDGKASIFLRVSAPPRAASGSSAPHFMKCSWCSSRRRDELGNRPWNSRPAVGTGLALESTANKDGIVAAEAERVV